MEENLQLVGKLVGRNVVDGSAPEQIAGDQGGDEGADDDGSEKLQGEASEDHFHGKNTGADGHVVRRSNPPGCSGCQEDLHVVVFQMKLGSEPRAQRGS